jgi:hypothetical protein
MEDLIRVIAHYWSAALATVLALIAIWQSRRANTFAKLVAESEGAFDQPKLSIRLFGAADTRRFVILAPITPSPLLFPLPLNVQNLGSATAADIQLLVRGNEDLLPYSREWLEREQPDASGVVIASFYGKEDHVNTVMYRIAYLHPGVPVNIINTAILRQPTIFSADVPIKTADGMQGIVGYTVAFDYRLEVVVFRKDGAPLADVFHFSIFDTAKQSASEALESYWRRSFSVGSEEKPSRRLWWRRSKSRIEPICVVTVDDTSILKDVERPVRDREAPVRALRGTMGVVGANGLCVPALGIALGTFRRALPHKTSDRAEITPKE